MVWSFMGHLKTFSQVSSGSLGYGPKAKLPSRQTSKGFLRLIINNKTKKLNISFKGYFFEKFLLFFYYLYYNLLKILVILKRKKLSVEIEIHNERSYARITKFNNNHLYL